MLGISRCMYYVGRAFTFFPYHVEDESISSISFLRLGVAKVWYVANSALQTSFRACRSSCTIRSGTSPRSKRCHSLDFGYEKILFDPFIILEDKPVTVEITRNIQEKGRWQRYDVSSSRLKTWSTVLACHPKKQWEFLWVLLCWPFEANGGTTISWQFTIMWSTARKSLHNMYVNTMNVRKAK